MYILMCFKETQLETINEIKISYKQYHLFNNINIEPYITSIHKNSAPSSIIKQTARILWKNNFAVMYSNGEIWTGAPFTNMV